MDDETQGLNLEELLGDVTPSLVTPKLGAVLEANSKMRPKLIAHLIIRGMAAGLKNPVTKEIIHNGEIHTVHYADVEPLCTGSWAMVSLMLLQLSYGEQSTIIEALYPKQLQLCAKAFAVIFTPELKSRPVIVQKDADILKGIECANAGIAMVIALLKHVSAIPHADEIYKNKEAMEKLVEAAKERDKYHKGFERSQNANAYRDGMSR